MLDELVKAVRLHLSERLTSPLIGAFAFSWCAWNYRIFIIIFSGESVENKFQLIDSFVFSTAQLALLKGIALPLATALIYIFVYPYPAKFVYSFARRKQREILEVRRRIEDETPLTIEDSRRIRSELAKAEQEFYSELDRKEREIERLKSQISSLSIVDESINPDPEINPEPERKAQPETEEISLDLLDMLRILDSQGGTATQAALISTSKLARIEAEFNLGELVRMGWATRRYSSPKRDHVYDFTHSGRAVLLSDRKRSANA